jgi:transcriptional regulator with XRE-family HTH domain
MLTQRKRRPRYPKHMNMIAEGIGIRIKKVRTELDISQRELAARLKVSAGLVGAWENHTKQPGLENLVALAKLADVKMEYLVGTEGFDETALSVSDPLEKQLIRRFRALTASQKDNLIQFLAVAPDISREMQKKRTPSKV